MIIAILVDILILKFTNLESLRENSSWRIFLYIFNINILNY